MNNVKSMLESVERVFQASQDAILSMQMGERMSMKQLTEKVSVSVNMDAKNILPFVSHFLHNTDLAYVTRGKNGGIIRGTRPEKNSELKA